MLASGPVELGIFRDDVERAMTDARGGREVTVERLTLQWSPAERRMFVVADGLSLRDKDGEEAGYARTAALTLDAGAILLGRVEVIEADLTSGWLAVQNVGPNLWTVAGDPLPEIRAAALPQTPEEWLERANSILSDVLIGLETFDGTFSLEGFEFSEFDLRVLDIDQNAIGTVTAASGLVSSLDNDVRIEFSGSGEGLGLPEEFAGSLDTFGGFQSLQTAFDVGILPVSDLVERFGIVGFEDSDLALATAFNASIDRDSGLERLGIAVTRDSGDPGL